MIELCAHAAALDGEPPLGRDAALLERIGDYRGYAELVRAWVTLCDAGARATHIGTSVRGVPLYALEIGPREHRRTSVVLGGLHALEWIGVEVLLGLGDALVRAPPIDRRVVLFPLVNVDGYRAVEVDLRARRRRMRRANANGVDLNRNWGTLWRRRRLLPAVAPFLGSSGREVASEPEVRAIREHLDACAGPGRESGARIDVALSLHSIGRQVLYSFGGRWRAPHDVARLRAAAEAVRDRLESARGVEHGYRARQCARWVPGAFAYGMEIDDLYARYGATALLVECSRGGASWRDPASLVHPFRWFNPRERAVVVRELVAALEPFVRGATSEGRR